MFEKATGCSEQAEHLTKLIAAAMEMPIWQVLNPWLDSPRMIQRLPASSGGDLGTQSGTPGELTRSFLGVSISYGEIVADWGGFEPPTP